MIAKVYYKTELNAFYIKISYGFYSVPTKLVSDE